jgi:hypothetical protein
LKKKKELDSYREACKKRERQLLDGLTGTKVDGNALHFFIENSHWMRAGEKKYIENIRKAEKEKDSAVEKEHEATAHYQQMVKNEIKLDEHFKAWSEENKEKEP